MNEKKCNEIWREKYSQYILEGDKQNAKELLLKVIPEDKLVYKYFRGIKRDFNTITKPALWLCNAYYLNDPFDCAFLIHNREEGIGAKESILNQIKSNVEAKNLQRTIFLSCFSERSDSILMWGHYANNHRGICVGYSLRELVEKFDCFPVIYDEKLVQHRNENTLLQETLTKYIEWSYEKEWRIVQIDESQRGSKGKLIDFIKPKIILLGLKNNDFLLDDAENNTGEIKDDNLIEIDAKSLIDYSNKELKTDCCQFEMCSDRFSLKKIIRI